LQIVLLILTKEEQERNSKEKKKVRWEGGKNGIDGGKVGIR